jgi:hypothetical protein
MTRRVRQIKSGALPEAAFQQRVEGLARFYGWLVFHDAPNRPKREIHSDRITREKVVRGYPDLTMVRVEHVGREHDVIAGGRLVVVDPGELTAAELLHVELKPDRATRSRANAAELAHRPDWLRHRDLDSDQAAWLEALQAVSDLVRSLALIAAGVDPDHPFVAVETYVWKPADWEFIQTRLARGRHLQRKAIDA